MLKIGTPSFLSPAGLSGIRLGDWLTILARNRFYVSPRYWGRAATITGLSIINSLFSMVERANWEARIHSTAIQPPLFILGPGRSGTTYLQQILCRDTRFGFVNLFQITFPHIFLSAENVMSFVLAPMRSDTRVQDNVRISWAAPAEDDRVMSILNPRAHAWSTQFPRTSGTSWAQRQTRGMNHDLPREKHEGWVHFLKKVTVRAQKPLVLKGPSHMCRIDMILESFPNARFIHIHRNPYDVVASSYACMSRVLDLELLQSFDQTGIREAVIDQYAERYTLFLQNKGKIPAGQLHEIGYDELERQPLETVHRTYRDLNLPDFKEVEPAVQAHLASSKNYQRNVHEPLCDHLRHYVASRCEHVFQAYGYVVQPKSSRRTNGA